MPEVASVPPTLLIGVLRPETDCSGAAAESLSPIIVFSSSFSAADRDKSVASRGEGKGEREGEYRVDLDYEPQNFLLIIMS